MKAQPPANGIQNGWKEASSATANGRENLPGGSKTGGSQREMAPSPYDGVTPPPRRGAAAEGPRNAAAASVDTSGSTSATAQGAGSAASSTVSTPVAPRKRGRRRLRTVAQVRARQNEIADKVAAGELDAKQGAIAVQALNGVLACLRVERGDEILKRLAALEGQKLGKRGSDA